MPGSPKTPSQTMRFLSRSAYTLVELLIALALSLLLLFGVAELFRHVGGSINEARSIISMSAQLDEAALLLRQDLARIPSSLAQKPKDIQDYIDNNRPEAPGDKDGYLEIIEGPDTVLDHPYVDEKDNFDSTVGDVDDIIGFTTTNDSARPYRGMIQDNIEERDSAEIVWFVRGNTLYRRQRLIDEDTVNKNNKPAPGGCSDENCLDCPKGDFRSRETLVDVNEGPLPEEGQYAWVWKDETTDYGPQRYDAVKPDKDKENYVWKNLLTHEDLARRARRFGHGGIGDKNTEKAPENLFPYPLYDKDDAGNDYAGWYYLRMPTFEESNYESKKNRLFWKTDINVPREPDVNNPDLWSQPHFFLGDWQERKSGSLVKCIENPRNRRAGEDVVLTNVLSFDVKVWDPDAKKFVDLGASDAVTWKEGKDKQPGLLNLVGNPPRPLHVWDSWTQEYKKGDGTLEPPPYDQPLEAIRITIRCFDPASRIIKQTTVVHRFQ